MADKELQDFTADTAAASGDILLMVVDPAGTPLSRKITVDDFLGAVNILAAITSGYNATEDEILLLDNAVAKKTTLPNLFAGIEDFLSAISATPAGTDTLLVIDGGVAKTVTFTNLTSGLQGKSRISLPASAWMSTSDVSSWASAQAQVKQSSDSVPSPRWIEWLFDASVDEFIVTAFMVPDNYSSAPVLDIYYKATSATSGTAAFQARVHAVTDGDSQDVDADAFATVNAGTATVPGTAGHMDVISITLTNNDSMAANDFCTMALNRDISADSVTGDLEVIGCQFRYTGS